jgi:hypothetical protein
MEDKPSVIEEPPPPEWVQSARWVSHHIKQNWEALTKPPVVISLMLVGLLGYRYGSSQSSEEISVKTERIAFLNDQIAAYKDRLQGATPDQAAKQLNTLQSKLDSTEAKLQMMLPDNFRHLSARELELMTIKVDDLLSIGQQIPLYASNIGDSLTYLNDFAAFFMDKKIPALGPFAGTCDSSERGLLVGLKDVREPSDKAKKFMEVLRFAGLNPLNTKWMGIRISGYQEITIPNLADFTLYICPP